MILYAYLLFVHIVLLFESPVIANRQDVWRWACEKGKCGKRPIDPHNKEFEFTLDICKMFCNEYGLLWPRPTGNYSLGTLIAKVNIYQIHIHVTKQGNASKLLQQAGMRFKYLLARDLFIESKHKSSGQQLNIFLSPEDPDLRVFSLHMDEGYQLNVTLDPNSTINATISGESFFGVRHGLETLSQLIMFDDKLNHYVILSNVSISDRPKFTYRGLMLDTARNYYPVSSIKKTINAMAAVKLNTFHWHITDAQSFPFVSERRPILSKIGAYGPKKVYNKRDIKDIVEYALVRGVRVLPEFDTPAHAGEGWQTSGLLECFDSSPWQLYCSTPPCGQLNPIKEDLYSYLEDVYTDMAEAFQSDMFHMGSDDVSEQCWRRNRDIDAFMRINFPNSSFFEMWNYFLGKAHDRLMKSFRTKIPVVIWSNELVNTNVNYLKKEDYIIQMHSSTHDVSNQYVMSKGFKMIASNRDVLYLHCGLGSWLRGDQVAGSDYCDYADWQTVYEYQPELLAGYYKNQVIGSEACLWSENVDALSMDSRIWPRTAALAERLWSNPTSDSDAAQERMLNIRNRLARMGIQADAVQPEWCYQNEGMCYRGDPLELQILRTQFALVSSACEVFHPWNIAFYLLNFVFGVIL